MSRKSTVWKIRTTAFLSHSVPRKRTFSKVSRVMASYGQVHVKMDCVHWIVLLRGFKFLRYGLCSHLMTYNTRPSKYPELWPPYTKFKRSAPCMLTCWYVLLSSYGFGYIVRRRKVILFGGSVHVNTELYGSIYSIARPMFVIHWHMKYGDKVPCKSYILFCIIYQGYAREDRIQAGRYLLLLRCFLLLMARCFHVCCRS